MASIKADANNLDPSSLLRQATAFEDEDHFEEAVQMLRRAYKLISKSSIDYGIQTFLRLPLYLQRFGKHDEAWQEFINLLENGYPNKQSVPGLDYSDQSLIYDKMRLFLQRANRNSEAIFYGIMSYISDLRSRCIMGFTNPIFKQYFEQYSLPTVIESKIMKLIRKTELQSSQDIFAFISRWISVLPNDDKDKFENELKDIIDNGSKTAPSRRK